MSGIAELKEKLDNKTSNTVLLTMASCGLYNLMWITRANTIIQDITQRHVASYSYIVWIFVLTGIAGALSGGTTELGDAVMLMVASIVSIAAGVLQIVWAFRARSALMQYAYQEHQLYLKMNGFYTFFLNIFYINYCINHLPLEAMRAQAVHGTATQSARPGKSGLPEGYSTRTSNTHGSIKP